MNNYNKTNLKWGLKAFAILLLAMLTIAVCAGVWNAGTDSWVSWCAGILLPLVGYFVVKGWKELSKEEPGHDEPQKK